MFMYREPRHPSHSYSMGYVFSSHVTGKPKMDDWLDEIIIEMIDVDMLNHLIHDWL